MYLRFPGLLQPHFGHSMALRRGWLQRGSLTSHVNCSWRWRMTLTCRFCQSACSWVIICFWWKVYIPLVVGYLIFLLRYTLGEWFNVSEQNGRILSLECAPHMMALSDRCLDSYLKLSGRAIQNGHFLFPARPKIHVTWFIPKLS